MHHIYTNCKVKLISIALGAILLLLYFVLRGNEALMAAYRDGFLRPFHIFMATQTGRLPFSLAGVLIAAGAVGAFVYIVFTIRSFMRADRMLSAGVPHKIRREAAAVFCGETAAEAAPKTGMVVEAESAGKAESKTGTAVHSGKPLALLYALLRCCSTLIAAAILIYAGFCWLWGVYYYTPDFEERSGIHAEPVSVEELENTTLYYTDLLNRYAKEVKRDENGIFAEDVDEIFNHSAGLYEAIEKKIPALSKETWKNGSEEDGERAESEKDAVRGLRAPAKRFHPSKAMSLLDFTGFYFPFTGEANINVDTPEALMPSTIAHELAHLRGVAEEDEANFFGILACLEDGDPAYAYSACLLAYIHLGNALYRADRDAWAKNYERLCPEAKTDLSENNAYWAKYRNKAVKKASNKVYTGFLQSYGQKDGLATYGKCVDLLVSYYHLVQSES